MSAYYSCTQFFTTSLGSTYFYGTYLFTVFFPGDLSEGMADAGKRKRGDRRDAYHLVPPKRGFARESTYRHTHSVCVCVSEIE